MEIALRVPELKSEIKQCFQRKTMTPKLKIESKSMLTALYCVTMLQAEIHQLFKGEHAQTEFWSNFDNTKCCEYLQYQVKVIEI